jgi:2-amino-4-hydroxy-6-hydroxymethyldihydropteridine diphosphokinase
MTQAFIALGSNLENPIQQIQSAFLALENIRKTQLIKKSALYQTAPIGYDESELTKIPDFINAVAELETQLSPLALLEEILNIENQAGRVRPYPNAPRVLDCDLLLYGDTMMQSEKLTLPHPRMHTRGFVLLPLFEIAPQLNLANHGKIATLMTEEVMQGVRRI